MGEVPLTLTCELHMLVLLSVGESVLEYLRSADDHVRVPYHAPKKVLLVWIATDGNNGVGPQGITELIFIVLDN